MGRNSTPNQEVPRTVALSVGVAFAILTTAIAMTIAVPTFPVTASIEPQYRHHAPINISGDSELTRANGVVKGSGTQQDPYVIEGWLIGNVEKDGVVIRHTTSHLVLRNMYLRGGYDGMSYLGIYLLDVSNIRLENCTIDRYGVGVFIDNDSGSSSSTGIEMDNLHIARSGIGIAAYYVNDGGIRGTHIYGTMYDGICLWYCSEIEIMDDEIVNAGYDRGWTGGSGYAAIQASNCSDISVRSNSLTGTWYMPSIALIGSLNSSISGNSVSWGSSSPISVSKSNIVSVIGNSIIHEGGDYPFGIEIQASSLCNVTENKLNGAGAVLANDTTDSTFADNVLSDGRGLNIRNSRNCTIVRNLVCNSSSENFGISGLLIDGSVDMLVRNNQLTGNSNGGLVLRDVTNAVVEDNLVAENMAFEYQGAGMAVLSSRDVALTGNMILSNEVEVYIDWSQQVLFSSNKVSGQSIVVMTQELTMRNNSFYVASVYQHDEGRAAITHNNFMTNTSWYYNGVEPPLSSWNSSYPDGGNFWASYHQADSLSGPNQDLPGSDGIGDEPMVLDGAAVDRYPLMQPIGFNDSVPPTTAPYLAGSQGSGYWFKSEVNVTLIASSLRSEINHTWVRVDGSDWVEYSATFSISDEGKRVLEYFSEDTVGLAEEVNTLNVWIDRTDPSIQLIGAPHDNVYRERRILISIDVTDDASGIEFVNPLQWSMSLTDMLMYNGSFVIDGLSDGTYYIDLYAIDQAGNAVWFDYTYTIAPSPFYDRGLLGPYLNWAMALDAFLGLTGLVLFGRIRSARKRQLATEAFDRMNAEREN
jgi:nitrous oxidase accessory protein NosD